VSGAEGAMLDLLAALQAGVEAVIACLPGPLADRAQALSIDAIELPAVSASFRAGPVRPCRVRSPVRDLYERIAHGATSRRVRKGRASSTPVQTTLATRRPLRVLFVEQSSVMGGGQHSLLELMRKLAGDHAVQLACPAGPLAERASSLGISVRLIPNSQLTFRLMAWTTAHEIVRTLRARRAVRREICLFNPDVVHANSTRWTACLLTGRDFIVIVHCRDLLPQSLLADMVSSFILHSSAK
jgi:hypothetical protein